MPPSGFGRLQPDDLDQLPLTTRPCASLHVTLISTSSPWATSAVMGVPCSCKPGLNSSKVQWVGLWMGTMKLGTLLTKDPLIRGTQVVVVTLTEMQLGILVVYTRDCFVGVRVPYDGKTRAFHSLCNWQGLQPWLCGVELIYHSNKISVRVYFNITISG